MPGIWIKVTNKQEAEDAVETIWKSDEIFKLLLVWDKPAPTQKFLEVAEARSKVDARRAGIYIILEDIPPQDLPVELSKEKYGLGETKCAVMLKEYRNSDREAMERLKPDEHRKIDPAFLK